MNNNISSVKRKSSYGTLVKKMMLSQFGAAMLGIMISIPTVEPNIYLEITTSSFAALFYMYILYTSVWDVAAKDKLAIDGGRLKEDKFKGLKASLIANAPTLAIGFISIVGRALNGAFRFGWATDVAAISSSVGLLWNSMYIGFINIFNPGAGNGNWALIRFSLLFFAVTVPALIACHLAYNAGLAGKRIIPEKKKND